MQRRKFSIRLEFSMKTIKVQGKIFEYVDGNLRTLVFSTRNVVRRFFKSKNKKQFKSTFTQANFRRS